ncbi:MAG: DUF47 family protein [Candidatus Verstraetearchaeota archaeon]|nr:DUF47 family protein [Candidatus Verstraetearchaeota archaeon]
MFKPTYSAIWFGRKREIEILHIVHVHFESILSVVAALRDLVHAACEENFEKIDEIFKLIFEREREADNVKESILNELAKGPFHPIDREDLIQLVLTADDIASNAKSAGRKISLAKPFKLPENVKEGLKEVSDLVYQITYKLKENFEILIQDPKKAIEVADKVERLEEKIDDRRVKLIVDILKWGDTLNKVSSWLMIKEAVENMEMIADKAEDTADVIRAISIIRI